MAKGPCFECGKPGHFAANCPEVVFAEELGTAADSRPPWCGECDRRTRMRFHADADVMTRCPKCNPNFDLPAQFKICKCADVVYRWDKSECGSHEEVRKQLPTTTGAK